MTHFSRYLIIFTLAIFCLLSFERVYTQDNQMTREEYDAALKKWKADSAAHAKKQAELLAKKSSQDKGNFAKQKVNDGNQYLRRGNSAQALSAYDEAIKLNPNLSDAHRGRGLALKSLRKYGDAEIAYKKAIELDSSNVQAYFSLGKLYSAQDRTSEALAVYDLAVAQNANWEKPYYEKAVLYQKLKEYKKAAAALRMATQLKPDYDKAYYLLGRILLADAKYDEAISAFETATALKSKYYQAHWGIARAYNKKGDFKASLSAAQTAIKIKPKDAMSNFEAGEACKALGRTGDAIAYFKVAAKNIKWRKSAEYEIKMLTEKH